MEYPDDAFNDLDEGADGLAEMRKDLKDKAQLAFDEMESAFTLPEDEEELKTELAKCPAILKAILSKDVALVRSTLEEDSDWVTSVKGFEAFADSPAAAITVLLAAVYNLQDVVKMLVLHGADCMDNEERKYILLMASVFGWAARPVCLEWMNQLVKAGASLDELGSSLSEMMGMEGCASEPNALAFFACIAGDADLLRFCFEHGVSPDATIPMDEMVMSLLLFASIASDVDMAKVLITAGADLTAPIVFESGSRPIVEVITDDSNGFSPEIRALFNVSKASATISKAIAKGNVSDLRIMSSADACTKDADARTPLHLAAASADAEHARQMVALLLEKGSDVHAQDKDGWTPLFYAAEAGHDGVVKLLAEGDPSVTEARSRSGESALHLAAKKCRMGVLKLLTQGAWAIRADVRDGAGLRPCDVVDASLRDSDLTYSFLVKRGHTHDFFLSHVQREASGVVRDLHTAIQGHRKGSSAWLDINEIPTEDGMLQGIADSCVFLLYLTPSIFLRKWCRFEVFEAVRRQRPMLLIRHADAAHRDVDGNPVVASYQGLMESLQKMDNCEGEGEKEAFVKLVEILLRKANMVDSTCPDLLPTIFSKLDFITSDIHAPVLSGWVDFDPLPLCPRGALAKLPAGQRVEEWKREHVVAVLTAARVPKARQVVFEQMGVTGKVLWTLSEGSMATQFRLTNEEAAKVRRICTAVNMYAQMLHECDIDQSGTIDEDEMMEFLQSVYGFRQKDSAAVRTIFKQLDRNNDKQIQAEEFVAGFNAYAVFAGVQ